MVEESSYDKDLKLLEQRRSLVVKKVQMTLAIVLAVLILHCMRVLTLQDWWLFIVKLSDMLSNGVKVFGDTLEHIVS